MAFAAAFSGAAKSTRHASINVPHVKNEGDTVAQDKTQTALNEALAKVTAQANGIFGNIAREVEAQVKKGATELTVVDIARVAGLQLDESTLVDLQIDRTVSVHPWLPWYVWFPCRPLWCWWWHRYHPWYRCCPWWWHRCHWNPGGC